MNPRHTGRTRDRRTRATEPQRRIRIITTNPDMVAYEFNLTTNIQDAIDRAYADFGLTGLDIRKIELINAI